jgi:3'(2'), 5'-bisphosphate nucleotidase
MTDDDLIALISTLAERAGEAILTVRARGFDVERKDDRSPVTEADRAAEVLIVNALREATPGIPVIAEEEVADGRVTAPSAEFWLVDPLDGTREFAAGHDEFAVNIGLIRDGQAVLGVVGVPALGELFGGIVGRGAWKSHAGVTAPIQARRPPEAGVTVLASRYHGNNAKLDAFLAGRRVASVTNYGSSLKFCRLAEGVADLYPRLGRTMEWDTGAPQAVLEAAGGRVTLLDSDAPLRYGKPGWENPNFVCYGAA